MCGRVEILWLIDMYKLVQMSFDSLECTFRKPVIIHIAILIRVCYSHPPLAIKKKSHGEALLKIPQLQSELFSHITEAKCTVQSLQLSPYFLCFIAFHETQET